MFLCSYVFKTKTCHYVNKAKYSAIAFMSSSTSVNTSSSIGLFVSLVSSVTIPICISPISLADMYPMSFCVHIPCAVVSC